MKRIILLLLAFTFQTAFSNTPIIIPVKPPQGFQSRLNFQPLVANPFEGRVGAIYQFSDNKLRLDIGNSLDVVEFDNDLAIGADFFTFTRLRSEGNFKFPVETSDYFFGLNFSKKNSIYEQRKASYSDEYDIPPEKLFDISYRLRLAHISSHLVDGLANKDGLLNPQPFVYSREFADLVGAIEWTNVRAYAGLTYVWAMQPRDAERLIPQLGIEYKHKLTQKFYAFAAYDFKFIGISDKYVGTHAAQAGINYVSKYGMPAISLNIYGYHGRSMHGMFYKERDSYIGTGFQFLF